MIGMLLLIRIHVLILLTGGIRSHHSDYEHLDEEHCQCGRTRTKIGYRIFNGTPVHPDDLGFVANVFFNTEVISRRTPVTNHLLLFNSLCTAVILNSKWFLSARSGINLKLFHQLRQSFFVGAGSTDLFKIYSDSNLYRLIREIYEPRELPSEHDIVLIETRTPFELGPKFSIYAACLFDAEQSSFKSPIVSGFGRRSATSKVDQKLERISVDEIPTPRRRALMAAYGLATGVRRNYSVLTNRNGQEIDSVQLKMTALSRFLTIASMSQVDCDLNKQNLSEENEKYSICLGHPQASACIGDAGAPMLTYSPPGERLLVAAIATPVYTNASAMNCALDQNTRFILVQPHLNWIRNRTGGPFCASQRKPSKRKGSLFGHVFVILLTSVVLITVFAVFWREGNKRRQREQDARPSSNQPN